jgi:hypothetical protein
MSDLRESVEDVSGQGIASLGSLSPHEMRRTRAKFRSHRSGAKQRARMSAARLEYFARTRDSSGRFA